jgi:hypothetical protein
VSIFYVLPPRSVVGDGFARFLQDFFPGLDWTASERTDLADRLVELLAGRPDVYVVHREELPVGEALAGVLAEAYGAEPGDEVVEVRPVHGAGFRPELAMRRWSMPPFVGITAGLGDVPQGG